MRIRIQLEGQPVELDVPEGQDPGAYVDSVMARHGEQEQYNAASESGLENFNAGMGRSVSNLGRNLVNVALPDELTPEFASDESLREANQLDEDLLGTGAGMAGNIVGDIAATAIPGGAVLKGARLARAAKLAGKGVSATGKLLRAAAANPVRYGMAEAAAHGALVGGPDDRGKNAAIGAVAAGTMGTALKVLKRAGTGIVRRTNAAREFAEEFDQFVPVSSAARQGGASGAGKNIYEHLVPAMPMTRHGTIGAVEEARDRFAGSLLDDAMPPTGGVSKYIPKRAVESMDAFRKVWDEAYEPFKGFPLRVDNEWSPGLTRAIKRLPKEEQKLFAKIASNGNAESGRLLSFRTDLIDAMSGAKKVDRNAYKAALNAIDEVFETSGQLPKQLSRQYGKMSAPYQKARTLIKASGKAPLDRFGPREVVSSAPKGSVLRKTAAKAQRALGEKALKDPGFWQRAVVFGAMAGGFMGGGPLGAVTAPAAIAALGKGVSSRAVQKALMGDTVAQKALSAILVRNGKAAEFARMVATATAGRTAVGEANAPR